MLIGFVSTIGFGDGEIVHTIDFGDCRLIEIGQTIVFGDSLLIGMVQAIDFEDHVIIINWN